MQRPESDSSGGSPRAGSVDRREDLRVTAPALDAAQQPGFKVVEEEPVSRSGRDVVLILLGVLLAIGVSYLFYLR